MRQSRSGLTLVEVLIAVIVLAVGIVALAGSSAMVTRMIGRGKAETHAAEAASRRMETLRQAAYSTSPHCAASSFASGGPVLTDGITQTWLVPANGRIRRVQVTVNYLPVRGSRSAVLETSIQC